MEPLPLDCVASYRSDFLSSAEARSLFEEIVEGYEVTNKMIPMAGGGGYESEMGIYMFCDEELTALEKLPEAWGARSPWPEFLRSIRDRIAGETGIRFEVARCLYYRDGSEGMDFHSDAPAYGTTDTIASLSLGCEREFVFRKTGDPSETYRIRLASGSLLFMGENCQQRYEHGVPRGSENNAPRINLTFRRFGWD